jgi:hypothetical protein
MCGIILSPMAIACDPGVTVLVSNETNKDLTIYIHDKNLANVAPHSEVEIRGIPRIFNHYPIEAKDVHGDKVFSRRFTEQELDDMDWRVAIPASPGE